MRLRRWRQTRIDYPALLSRPRDASARAELLPAETRAYPRYIHAIPFRFRLSGAGGRHQRSAGLLRGDLLTDAKPSQLASTACRRAAVRQSGCRCASQPDRFVEIYPYSDRHLRGLGDRQYTVAAASLWFLFAPPRTSDRHDLLRRRSW